MLRAAHRLSVDVDARRTAHAGPGSRLPPARLSSGSPGARMRRHTAKKASLAAGLSLSVALAALTSATPVLADPLAQVPIAGAVVGLTGTNHLWIADAL